MQVLQGQMAVTLSPWAMSTQISKILNYKGPVEPPWPYLQPSQEEEHLLQVRWPLPRPEVQVEDDLRSPCSEALYPTRKARIWLGGTFPLGF
jgi:hypothetical protein